jgi:hypothetical protein
MAARGARVAVTFAARLLLSQVVQVQAGCVQKQNACSFSNIINHCKRSLLFVMHVDMPTLARE